MKYELDTAEAKLIEQYRNLLPEYQKAALENLNTLFMVQTEVVKSLIGK